MAVLVLAAAALVGCKATPEEIQRAQLQTKASMNSPIKVGNLPDGREVRRFIISNAGRHDHVVYYIDHADVTLNQTISEGKTTRNVVSPTLSLSQEDAAVLAKADAIRKAHEDAERAEFERLKAVYGE